MSGEVSGDFNLLVREAFSAQEAFDNFDPREPGDHEKLTQLVREWTAANVELITFAQQHGDNLKTYWAEPASS